MTSKKTTTELDEQLNDIPVTPAAPAAPAAPVTPAITKMYIAKTMFTKGSNVFGYPARQVPVKPGEEPLVEVDVPTERVATEKTRAGQRLMTKAQYNAIKKAELGE